MFASPILIRACASKIYGKYIVVLYFNPRDRVESRVPQESEANAALLFSLVHDIKVSWGGVELSTKKKTFGLLLFRPFFVPRKTSYQRT